jgi:hypothetical protein
VRALSRLAFLAIAILAFVLFLRDCVPSRIVFPAPSSTFATGSPTATRSATAFPSATVPATATSPATFRLTVTDAELTKAAESSFPQTVSGVTVRDPVVRTTTSGVRLTATARVFFGTTQFLMTGTPYASDGRVAVRVDSIALGGFGLPDSVRESTQKAVENAIAALVPPSVTVERVSLGEGSITIEGVTRR